MEKLEVLSNEEVEVTRTGAEDGKMFCNLVAAATSVGVMGQEYSVLVTAAKRRQRRLQTQAVDLYVFNAPASLDFWNSCLFLL